MSDRVLINEHTGKKRVNKPPVGLVNAADVRPSATYPRDLFFDSSLNPFLNQHLNLSACWYPPARWTSCPNHEVQPIP